MLAVPVEEGRSACAIQQSWLITVGERERRREGKQEGKQKKKGERGGGRGGAARVTVGEVRQERC